MWAPATSKYYRDPVGWVSERAREFLWSKQREILESVRDNRLTAVRSCHGSGKSFTASRLTGWWLDSHPPGTAFVVTTAPTDKQVKAILWREITRLWKKLRPPLGRVLQNAEWKIGNELVAYGRKPADYDETAFQGIHARYVLVILDEAGGIPKNIWTGADTLVTNEDSRILATGNPDDPNSTFAVVCEGAPEDGTTGMSAQGWNVIEVSAFDTPNFTGEPIPGELRHVLVGQTWVEERARKWGVDSPLYTSKVLGRFPQDAKGGVIPWSFLRQCQGPDAHARVGLLVPVELGVDVGGSDNGDRTSIRERPGVHGGRQWTIQSGDPEKVLDLIMGAIVESGASSVKVDAIGIGWGLVGNLRERGRLGQHRALVHAVVVSKAAEQAKRFVNLRAELWWEIGREFSQQGVWDLSEIDDDTAAQLTSVKYFEVNGRVQIESKEDIRKRELESPDDADALLLAFYVPRVDEIVETPHNPQADTRFVGRR